LGSKETLRFDLGFNTGVIFVFCDASVIRKLVCVS